MSYYPEPDSRNRDKVIIVLDLSNDATKKELEYATGVDSSNLASKRNFIPLKAEVDKLDIKTLIYYLTGLNNLKAKADDLELFLWI